MRSELDIVLTPYIEMLRLFIRAAHALKVGKNQNLTARESGCGKVCKNRDMITPAGNWSHRYIKNRDFSGNREF